METILKSDAMIKNIDNIKKIVVLADTHIPVRAAKIPDRLIGYFKEADLIIHAGAVSLK